MSSAASASAKSTSGESPASEDVLRLMTVHAHPDDESSKGAATVARYVDEGVRAVLVCCTGGEEGSVLNPALDNPETRRRLPEIRREELARAAEIIGYHEVKWLGYRDSGMAEEERSPPEGSFAAAPLAEAAGRLVAMLRAERPHVLIIYADDQQGYRHPDHLMAHDAGAAAYWAAGDPTAYPEAGEPWQIPKLYYSVWSKAHLLATHEKILELGRESPFSDDWFKRRWLDHRVTTRIEAAKWYDRRCDALLAHETQVDPNSPFWFALPREVARSIYTTEDYILAHSRVHVDLPEEDLFAGLRLGHD